MNIHPIFVHFPIALLTVYAIIELIRIQKFQSKNSIFYIKCILVVLGWIASIIAASTGDIAADLIGENRLIETHAFYAGASQVVFGIIAVWYALIFLEKEALKIPFFEKQIRPVLTFLFVIARKIQMCIPALAIVGLILITITGALGGAIVYGPEIDPVVYFVYNLLL